MAPPPMTARAKAKAKKEAAALLSQQQAKNYTHLTAEKAAILVDKNSRTIVKLSQLLEIYNKPGASDLDTRGVVAKRIEQYKRRISRRLVKLAKFVDTPENVRPVEKRKLAAGMTTRGGGSNSALEEYRLKREQIQKQGKLKEKKDPKVSKAKAAMEQRLKVQRLKVLAQEAKKKNLTVQPPVLKEKKSPALSPTILRTTLPDFPPPTSSYPVPLQVIYSADRIRCKHTPSAPTRLARTSPQPTVSSTNSTDNASISSRINNISAMLNGHSNHSDTIAHHDEMDVVVSREGE